MYGLNAISGQLEERETLGNGVQFFSDGNSQPTPAARMNTGSLNYGTPGNPIIPPLVPVRVSGDGVDPLKSDPNVTRRPGADVRDKRQTGAAVFG